MTALTPQQMRDLADDSDDRADYIHSRSPGLVHKLTAALRTAADQLEAVQALALTGVSNVDDASELLDRIYALTADTAPQSDRIEDVMQRNWKRRYGSDTAPQEGRDD